MKKRYILTSLMVVVLLTGKAQIENNSKKSLLRNNISMEMTDFRHQLPKDTIHLNIETLQQILPSKISDRFTTSAGLSKYSMMQGTKTFNLWQSGYLSIHGSMGEMPGLMSFETGGITLRQDFGKLHVTVMAKSNKYWMPMQGTLMTQSGIGTTFGFDVSNLISLYAFGYYYNYNPIVSPAFYPHIQTATYGGFADIRFSNHVGSHVGVRRYVNPMSGHWTTEPIITPYFHISKKVQMELPLGGLLKAAIWGAKSF